MICPLRIPISGGRRTERDNLWSWRISRYFITCRVMSGAEAAPLAMQRETGILGVKAYLNNINTPVEVFEDFIMSLPVMFRSHGEIIQYVLCSDAIFSFVFCCKIT